MFFESMKFINYIDRLEIYKARTKAIAVDKRVVKLFLLNIDAPLQPEKIIYLFKTKT